MDHCQDYSLVTDGVMHEGYWSTALGLRGWPAAGEEMIVARNILLAELTGAKIHCQHLSAAGSVALLREAKKRGVPISGEACPHHFTLTDAAVAGSGKFWGADGKILADSQNGDLPQWLAYDTNFKMNPPLRSREDREALLAGLVDGAVDCVATDHAPHAEHEKNQEFDRAPFGMTGLETALGLCISILHYRHKAPLTRIVELLSANPARVMGLQGRGTLAAGARADVTIFDPAKKWTYHVAQSHSKSKNSPFDGWQLQGRVIATIVGGAIKFQT
jgi:dihydroorotase